MPNNKKYNVKDIKKKEGCHPYSRKAKQLSRALNRMDKLENKKGTVLTGLQAHMVDKFLWFKFAMDQEKACFSFEEVRELIEDYLKRESEAEEFKKGKSFKEDILTLKNLKEKELYHSHGLEIPDLTNKNSVKALKAWDGDWNSVSSIKVLKIKSLIKRGE